jgi:adenylate cyclase
VLPLVARSSDEEAKALADGLTDDITSGLSRFGYIRVVSRSITERMAREQVAIHTQARYAIEGHVRKSGTTIRVGISLVDAQNGTNLWTHTFDRDAAAGAFALQDEIASTTVATIGDQTGSLVRAMAAALADKPLDRMSVPELVVRYHLYAESFRVDEHARLRDSFEHALKRDPRAAEGWACLAMLYQQELGFSFNPLPDPLARLRQAAEKATELDPLSQQAWIAMATCHGVGRDREGLKAAADRAFTLNPLNADLVATCAIFLSMASEHQRAAVLLEQAMRHKPHHPGWYHFPLFNACFCRGDYDAALREIKAVNMPKMPTAHFLAAAVSGQLGKATEATAALTALRDLNPAFLEPATARAYWAKSLWDETYIDGLLEGFKKALTLANHLTSTTTAQEHKQNAT